MRPSRTFYTGYNETPLKETEMTKLDIVKKAVSFVVGAGVSKIVHDIIANNVETEKIHHQVSVPVASVVIGMAAADATSSYTDAKIDEIAEALSGIFSKSTEK